MNCNSCGTDERIPHWTVRGYDIYRCSRCGLFYTGFRDADLSGIYEKDYYLNVYPDYESDRNFHCMNYSLVLDRLERLVPKGSILEVGSAFGFFLHCAMQRGWHVHGYEISRHASEIAKVRYGVDVSNTDFITAPISELYDCICIFDTIEHVPDPDALVRKISSVLRPRGILVITTGDIGSFMGGSLADGGA